DPPGGHAAVHPHRLSAAGDHRAGADHASPFNGDVGDDGRIGPDPHVLDQADGPVLRGQFGHGLGGVGVVVAGGGEDGMGGDVAVGADVEAAPAVEDAPGGEMAVIAHAEHGLGAAAHLDVGVDVKAHAVLDDQSAATLDDAVEVERHVI